MNLTLRFSLITVFRLSALLLSLGAPHAARAEERPSQVSRQQAEALWEQAIAAKGGRARLAQVNSLAISYEETARNLLGRVVHRGQVERLYVFPDKSWSWDDGLPPPFHLTVNMFNRERRTSCTVSTDAPAPRCSEPRDADSFFHQGEGLARTQYLYLLETKWTQPAPLAATAGRLGTQAVDIVRTVVNGRRVDYYFDRRTHLARRIVTFFESGRVWETYDFSDYLSVEGIQMPGRQKNGRLNFQINPAYDESIFTRPPSIEAGAKAWQAARRADRKGAHEHA